MFAQHTARILIQRFHVIGDLATRHHAKVLDHLEGKATGQPGQRLVFRQVQKGFEQCCDLAVDKVLQAAFDLVDHILTGHVINECLDLRFQRVGPGHKFAHSGRAPHKAALFGIVDFGVRRVIEPVRPEVEVGCKRLQGSRLDGLCFGGTRALILSEAEAFQLAHEFTLDSHLTGVIYIGHYGLLLAQSAQQNTGAPIYKSFRQRAVQRIRQPVFYMPRRIAPMAKITCPTLPLRHVGPRSNERKTFGQRINVAIGSIYTPNLSRKPVIGQHAVLVQVVENHLALVGVFLVADAAEIGYPADIPQQFHRCGVAGAGKDLVHL